MKRHRDECKGCPVGVDCEEDRLASSSIHFLREWFGDGIRNLSEKRERLLVQTCGFVQQGIESLATDVDGCGYRRHRQVC